MTSPTKFSMPEFSITEITLAEIRIQLVLPWMDKTITLAHQIDERMLKDIRPVDWDAIPADDVAAKYRAAEQAERGTYLVRMFAEMLASSIIRAVEERNAEENGDG